MKLFVSPCQYSVCQPRYKLYKIDKYIALLYIVNNTNTGYNI